MASRSSKDQSKQVHEKHQAILSRMLKDDDNKYCVDCDAKGPRWASWNLGVFLCIRCAGIHRNLGVHISKVKSINLDSWTPEQLASMEDMGNSRARAIYEANLTDNYKRPANSNSAMEQFIRAKYEHKKYIAKEWIPSKPRSAPSQYYGSEMDAKKETKKETKKPKPVLTVPGAASGTAAASKAKEKKPPLQKETNGSLIGDFSSPASQVEPPKPPASTSADLLADIFSSQPAAPSTAGNTDLFASTASPTPATNGAPSAGDSSGQDLFQQGETKTQSTKDSIMALFGSAPAPQPAMMAPNAYGMQASYSLPGQVPQAMPMSNGSMMNYQHPQQQQQLGNPQMMMSYPAPQQNYAYPNNMMANSMGSQGMMATQQGMMGNPQLQHGMMGNAPTSQGMMGNPYGMSQPMYGQQLPGQMAAMSLNQGYQAPQQVPVATGTPSSTWGNNSAQKPNGQTLNFDLWN